MPVIPLSATGPAVTLRYPAPSDAPELFALANDPAVTKFFSWRYRTVEDAERWIAARAASREAGEWLEFVVEHRERGIAGVTGLTEPSRRDGRAVTGSWLGSAFWGTGVNTESKALLARIAFDACRCVRLGSYASPFNPRSRGALEKIGFVHEGTLRHYHRHGDTLHDVDVFGLLRDDWAAGPLAAVPATVAGTPPDAFLSL
jgi:ribosomal-protein-alanine N-acetyltransferase